MGFVRQFGRSIVFSLPNSIFFSSGWVCFGNSVVSLNSMQSTHTSIRENVLLQHPVLCDYTMRILQQTFELRFHFCCVSAVVPDANGANHIVVLRRLGSCVQLVKLELSVLCTDKELTTLLWGAYGTTFIIHSCSHSELIHTYTVFVCLSIMFKLSTKICCTM